MALEQRLIDANADVGNEITKIKTHHPRIVVDGTADKPYYSIEWYDPAKKAYYLGYSSYNIELVFNWLSECFEIVDAPTVDAVEVPDKELLRAIKLLIKQYKHSKNSEYVHSPVAHALFHTWKQVEERRTDHV